MIKIVIFVYIVIVLHGSVVVLLLNWVGPTFFNFIIPSIYEYEHTQNRFS